MAMVSGPGQVQQEKCGCSIGWVLFGVSVSEQLTALAHGDC
jgi:hypothetical protein